MIKRAIEPLPDIALGQAVNRKWLKRKKLIMPGRDRTLNTSVLTGEATKGNIHHFQLSLIKQDLNHFVKYVHDFPHVFHNNEMRGKYLTGISLIGAEHDLYEKLNNEILIRNIPKELVTCIDPLDPSSPGLNIMNGSLQQVIESVTLVVSTLFGADDKNEIYIKETMYQHLKFYLSLLKLQEQSYEATFEDFIEMYRNPQCVRKLHLNLKSMIPETLNEQELDREQRSYWQLVQEVDQWFDLNLLPKSKSVEPSDETVNGAEYFDAKEAFVKGLRNVLYKLEDNQMLQRVLFSKQPFDINQHIELGGILILKTTTGITPCESKIISKTVLLGLQYATFERDIRQSTFHHVMLFNTPNSITKEFREWLAQSRVLKTIFTMYLQSWGQITEEYGREFCATFHTIVQNHIFCSNESMECKLTHNSKRLPVFKIKPFNQNNIISIDKEVHNLLLLEHRQAYGNVG